MKKKDSPLLGGFFFVALLNLTPKEIGRGKIDEKGEKKKILL